MLFSLLAAATIGARRDPFNGAEAPARSIRIVLCRGMLDADRAALARAGANPFRPEAVICLLAYLRTLYRREKHGAEDHDQQNNAADVAARQIRPGHCEAPCAQVRTIPLLRSAPNRSPRRSSSKPMRGSRRRG